MEEGGWLPTPEAIGVLVRKLSIRVPKCYEITRLDYSL